MPEGRCDAPGKDGQVIKQVIELVIERSIERQIDQRK